MEDGVGWDGMGWASVLTMLGWLEQVGSVDATSRSVIVLLESEGQHAGGLDSFLAALSSKMKQSSIEQIVSMGRIGIKQTLRKIRYQ